MWKIQKLTCYSHVNKFELEVNDKPLVYLHSGKDVNTRSMRQTLLLSLYFAQVKYIKDSEDVGVVLMIRHVFTYMID